MKRRKKIFFFECCGAFVARVGEFFFGRGIGFFYQWQGIFLQEYWNFFFNGSVFLE